ncbi:MAG: N-formylglutamate amidohydrolase [Planctomycetes bacterium]|nr:N-formylglutamate amidohydrolase [Planctomycetota bacterium]
METYPLVFHIPHLSQEIPSCEMDQFLMPPLELKQAIEDVHDVGTDFTRDFRKGVFGHEFATSVVFPYSRYLVDVERFEDEAIHEQCFHGRPLRKRPSDEERERLLNTYYRPHHERLTNAVDHALDNYGKCLIVDCHSYPVEPFPFENVEACRPMLCIGADDFHTPPEIVESLQKEAREQEISCAVNSPFSGALTPLKHYRRDHRVKSVMIELRRDSLELMNVERLLEVIK